MIAVITDAVQVGVDVAWAELFGAVVCLIGNAITIDIRIAEVAETVFVFVLVAWASRRHQIRTAVAGVAASVAITIFLVGVVDAGAVVFIGRNIIPIPVVNCTETPFVSRPACDLWAGITGVAHAVAVAVWLAAPAHIVGANEVEFIAAVDFWGI